MKKYSIFLMLLMAIVYFGCKDEDPDLRQPFVGMYAMDDFDVTYTEIPYDTTVSIGTNPELNFEIDETLDADEMRLDVEEFVEEAVIGTFQQISSSSGLSIQFDDEGIVKVDNNEFEVNDFDFRFLIDTQQYPCELNGKGSLANGVLTFDFEVTLYAGFTNVTFTGITTGALN